MIDIGKNIFFEVHQAVQISVLVRYGHWERPYWESFNLREDIANATEEIADKIEICI